MPIVTLASKNAVLNAIEPSSMSLHTGYDPNGLALEVFGGSPGYARLPVTFAAASSGQRSLTGAPYTFDVPATTVAFVGLWDVSLNFIAIVPNGGDSIKPFVVDDLAANTIKSAAHGFLVGDTLVVWSGSAGLLPSPLTEGPIYYVVAADANSLQISATSGGAPIGITVSANGFLQRITPTLFTSQDHFIVSALTLDATVAA